MKQKFLALAGIEGQYPQQLQQFVDDNQQQIVDDLNMGMEQEMDQNDINTFLSQNLNQKHEDQSRPNQHSNKHTEKSFQEVKEEIQKNLMEVSNWLEVQNIDSTMSNVNFEQQIKNKIDSEQDNPSKDEVTKREEKNIGNKERGHKLCSHVMRIQNGSVDGVPFHLCDSCQREIPDENGDLQEPFYRCNQCDIDACQTCYHHLNQLSPYQPTYKNAADASNGVDGIKGGDDRRPGNEYKDDWKYYDEDEETEEENDDNMIEMEDDCQDIIGDDEDECGILSDEEEYSIEEQQDDQDCYCSDNADQGLNDSSTYANDDAEQDYYHHNPGYSSQDGDDEAEEEDEIHQPSKSNVQHDTHNQTQSKSDQNEESKCEPNGSEINQNEQAQNEVNEQGEYKAKSPGKNSQNQAVVSVDNLEQKQTQDKFDKMKEEVEQQLEVSLTDMLVNLYNSKEQSQYEGLYIKVIQKLLWQYNNIYAPMSNNKNSQTNQKLSTGPGGGMIMNANNNAFNSKYMGDLYIGRIKEIIQTVKRKLIQDSRKEKLIEHCLNPNIKDKKLLEEEIYQQQLQMQSESTLGQFISYKYVKDMQTQQSIERPVLTKIKIEYKDEPYKYDEIIQAIGDYFDLFKNKTDQLECLWLQMLNYFELKPPQDHTIFREQHYKNYKKIVISNRTLKLVIEEAMKYRNTKYASDMLGANLDKIQMIITESRQLPETYINFIKNHKIKQDLNQKAQEKIKHQLIKSQQILKNKVAQQQQQMQQHQIKIKEQKQQIQKLKQNQPAYNGFANPHNAVGHRCDINCFNSMTMANQFPNLVKQKMGTQQAENQATTATAQGDFDNLTPSKNNSNQKEQQQQTVQNDTKLSKDQQQLLTEMKVEQIENQLQNSTWGPDTESLGVGSCWTISDAGQQNVKEALAKGPNQNPIMNKTTVQNTAGEDNNSLRDTNIKQSKKKKKTKEKQQQQNLMKDMKQQIKSMAGISNFNEKIIFNFDQDGNKISQTIVKNTADPGQLQDLTKSGPLGCQNINQSMGLASLGEIDVVTRENEKKIVQNGNGRANRGNSINMTTQHFSFQQFQQKSAIPMKNHDKLIRSDGPHAGIDIEKRYEQNLDDIMKYIEQSSDSTHTNPKNVDKTGNTSKNKKKKNKKDLANASISENKEINEAQETLGQDDTQMAEPEITNDKVTEKDKGIATAETIVQIDYNINDEEEKGEDEPKKKKRRRKNRKRGKKHADDDDVIDDENDLDDVEAPLTFTHKGIIVNLEQTDDEVEINCSPENVTVQGSLPTGTNQQQIICVSRLTDQEFDQSLLEFSRRMQLIESEFHNETQGNIWRKMKLIPNLNSDWVDHLILKQPSDKTMNKMKTIEKLNQPETSQSYHFRPQRQRESVN